MEVVTEEKQIEEVLTRGVDKIYPTKEDFKKKLLSGEKIKLYLGIDPTGADLHIGHTVPLRKIRQFQDLGHEVILLVGDFTGMIGDPTGKDKTRKKLTREDVLQNCKNYQQQAGKILDFKGKNAVQLKFNSEWLDKLNFKEIIELASHFTVQQMLERDMFSNRHKTGQPISLYEFFYPLMQGYDSVAMEVDLEVGATDQTFNMLAGRTLLKAMKKQEKFVLTVPLLTDNKGNKIGKTTGNYIALDGEPNELYGQIMALSDEAIINTFILCTDVSTEEIKQMEQEMKDGGNPRDYKAKLAHTLATMYHGEKAAKTAAAEFDKIFKDKQKPTDIEEVKVEKTKDLIELLMQTKLVPSKSQARRLVEQGGVRINDEKVTTWKKEIEIKAGDVVQVGKRKFAKIVY